MARGSRILAALLVLAGLVIALAWMGGGSGAPQVRVPEEGRGSSSPTSEKTLALPVDLSALEPEERARNEVARGLRGRVVARPSGGGVEGVALRLLASGELLAETASAADGTFAFEAAPRANCRLELDPPAGTWVHELPVIERRHLEGKPLRVVLAPLGLAPFRGRVVDADTGEPVPALELRVHGAAGGYETVLSDARGRFQTEGLSAAGELAVEAELVGEDPWRGTRSVHAHYPAGGMTPEQIVEARVGPTYRLRIVCAEELAPAQLVAWLSPDAELADADWRRGLARRVVAGEPPWVRFPRWAWGEEAHAWLYLRTHSGSHEGRAQVTTTRGVQQAPLEVQLESMGRISGRVLDEDGTPVGGARVELSRLDGAGGARVVMSAGNGRFLLEPIAPGRYALSVVERGAGRGLLELEVAAGELLEPEVRLAPFPIAGDVEGVLRSTTGGFSELVRVSLVPSVGSEDTFLRRANVEWSDEAGERVGRFHIPDIARGSYLLHLYVAAPHAIEPASLWLSPPASVELRLYDEVEARRLFAVALDPETKDRVADVHLRATAAGGALLHDGPLEDWPGHLLLRADEPFDWVLGAPGRAERRGDRSALRWRPGPGPGSLVVELARTSK